MSELTFEQMLEESLKTIHNGEVVEGTVIDVKADEAILDRLFDQTKYRADIDKLAEELANQFIQNLNLNGVDSSVKTLVADIKQPVVTGRARRQGGKEAAQRK